MLRFDPIEGFQAPDQFVYLCNATGFAPNNYAPIFHLGKQRVKKVVICCGAPERSTDSLDQKHALGPATSLGLKLPGLLGIAKRDILTLYGDPDRTSTWLGKGGQIKTFAGDLPILANLQGGTTQMSLGINDALRLSGLAWARVTVTKPPIRTVVGALFGNAVEDRIIPLANVAEHVPQNLLFELRGLGFDHEDARAKRAAYAELDGLADSVWTKLNRPDLTASQARQKLAAFNGTVFRNDEKDIEKNGLDLMNVPRDQKDMLARLFEFDQHPGSVTDKRLNPGHFASFVTGGWLEQATLNELRRKFAKRTDISFTLNVPLRGISKTDDEGEADILIKHGDCLHVVEVKTTATIKQLRSKHRNQAANNRKMVGGEMARSWLVMPFLKSEGAAFADLQSSCRLSEVTLIAGLGALKTLVDQVGEATRT